MKMIMAVVPTRLMRRIRERLLAEGRSFTRLSSSGGLFGEGNSTLLIVVGAKDVDDVLAQLAEVCAPRQATINLPAPEMRAYANPADSVHTLEVGGLHAFVLNVEQAVHL